MRVVTIKSSLALLAILSAPQGVIAQLDITGALKRGAEREANRQAEQLGRESVRCAVNNLKCIKKAEKKGKDVVLVDDDGNPIEESDDGGGKPPGLSSSGSSSSDFRPGTRVIFEEDFTTALGDFPGSLDPIQGQMRVVDWNGVSYLRTEDKYSRMAIPLQETLPEDFTLEFDLFEGTNGGNGVSVALTDPERYDFAWAEYYDYHYLNVGNSKTAGIWAPKSKKLATSQDATSSQRIVPVKIMVEGDDLKMYVGDRRVAHHTNADLGRSDKIYFFLDSLPPENLTYIGNIRIAEIEN